MQISSPLSTLHNNWIRLRSDGVVKKGSGFVAIRGVMRDQNERWILGYNMYLGFRSVMEAELWGILNGLTLLLEQNYDTVLIQTDSMEAILAIHEFG